MTEQEQIQYLANLCYLARADGDVDRIEEKLLDEMARGIGAGYFEVRKAMDLSAQEGFTITIPERWSDRVRTIEDMLLLAYMDKRLHHLEKELILDYANKVGITDKQIKLIQKQTKERLKKVKK